MDVDPAVQRIADMSDDELSNGVEGPHRLPDSSAGPDVLLCVRSFVIATGHLEGLGDPIPLRTDRRGREITGRAISVTIDHRLSDLTSRPSKAVENARWLGRRARVGTGGAVLPLQSGHPAPACTPRPAAATHPELESANDTLTASRAPARQR